MDSEQKTKILELLKKIEFQTYMIAQEKLSNKTKPIEWGLFGILYIVLFLIVWVVIGVKI